MRRLSALRCCGRMAMLRAQGHALSQLQPLQPPHAPGRRGRGAVLAGLAVRPGVCSRSAARSWWCGAPGAQGERKREIASNGLWTHQNDEKLGFLRGHGFSVAWWRTLLSSSTLRHRATRCVGGPHAGRNLPPPPAKCTPVGQNALLSGPICRESTKIQNFSTPPPGAARCGAGSGVLGVAAIRPAAAAYVDT